MAPWSQSADDHVCCAQCRLGTACGRESNRCRFQHGKVVFVVSGAVEVCPVYAQQLRQLDYARALIAAAGSNLQQHGMGEEDAIAVSKPLLHPPLHLRQPLVVVLKLGIDPNRAWNVLQLLPPVRAAP